VTDVALQQAQERAFLLGLFPGLAVVIGKQAAASLTGTPGERPLLTKEQRLSIITALKQAYRGSRNYDEPIILDALIEDVKKVTQNPREMDFLNSGNATKERVTQGFGTNPIVMGEIEGANRASAIVADRIFCDVTINPKIELISQCLTRWVAPRY